MKNKKQSNIGALIGYAGRYKGLLYLGLVLSAADKIVVLCDGRVAETGSPADLMAKDNGIFRNMTGLQAGNALFSI